MRREFTEEDTTYTDAKCTLHALSRNLVVAGHPRLDYWSDIDRQIYIPYSQKIMKIVDRSSFECDFTKFDHFCANFLGSA